MKHERTTTLADDDPAALPIYANAPVIDGTFLTEACKFNGRDCVAIGAVMLGSQEGEGHIAV